MKVCVITLVIFSILFCAIYFVGNREIEIAPTESIGYAIIHHSDGDEHFDIYHYDISNVGIISAYGIDGRIIKGYDIIIILEDCAI